MLVPFAVDVERMVTLNSDPSAGAINLLLTPGVPLLPAASHRTYLCDVSVLLNLAVLTCRNLAFTCSKYALRHFFDAEPRSYVSVSSGMRSESNSALTMIVSSGLLPMVSDPSRSTVSPSPATLVRAVVVLKPVNLMVLAEPIYKMLI